MPVSKPVIVTFSQQEADATESALTSTAAGPATKIPVATYKRALKKIHEARAHSTSIPHETAAPTSVTGALTACRLKLQQLATWLDRNAQSSEEGARTSSAFPALAEARRADARNFRATASDIRLTIAIAERALGDGDAKADR